MTVQFGHRSAEPLPPLPTGVELAAYRIAVEALTNIVRHAQAHIYVIRLSLTDAYSE